MGNCSTTESSTEEQRKAKRIEKPPPVPPPPKTNVILYDEGTGEEYSVGVANQESTVWRTVLQECTRRNRRVIKINYGGTDISETQTWEELGISDDATVMVYTTEVP